MRTTESAPDEVLILAGDEEVRAARPPENVWRVLVVDDDEDVHESTRFALKRTTLLGRSVQLMHARSAAEGLALAKQNTDIAVALVDVVMDTPHAGLALVRDLRISGLREMRVVLRTGQPGYAPELAVMAACEIDDYRTKAELTRVRLITVLTAAVRAYDQICTIKRSREGLEMIVESSAKLFQRTNLELFSRGVLTQIAGLLGVVPNGLVCVSSDHPAGAREPRIVSAAGRLAPLMGKTRQSIDDATVLGILEDAQGRSEPLERGGYLGICCRRASGRELVALIETHSEVAAADLALLRLFSTNIAVGFENVALLEKLDRLAYLDPVLQIPNLNAFEAGLRMRGKSAVGPDCMALINIDSLQTTAAAYGQQLADSFLSAVHAALNDDGKEELLTARIGDAQLAILGMSDTLTPEFLEAVFARPYRIGGIEISAVATSVLIDLNDVEADTDAIMQVARSSLLHVTQNRRGSCVKYGPSMRVEVDRRTSTEMALKTATKTAEAFGVHLQPKYDLRTGDVVGAEALLRWTHEGHSITPTEFVPIAESAGLIQRLTEIVIDRVGVWHREAARVLPAVAINLSMADLNRRGFAEWLLRQLSVAGLSAQAVEFEVTEGIAMQDTPWAIQQVRVLHEAGFRIALDDFGTGYCSLGHFDQLPIDVVKIDRRFVSPLNLNNARGSLAAVFVGMAHVLGVDCIAEGIERAEQLEALISLGCNAGQGYLLGRPIDIDDFAGRFLKSQE